MDSKRAIGDRAHIRLVIDTTPTLLFTEHSGRDAVVMYNEGPADMLIGYSGSLATEGMRLAADQGFTDNYSRNDWWGMTESSSGTFSGFLVF